MNTLTKSAVVFALASQIFVPATAQASSITPVTSVNLGTLVDGLSATSSSTSFSVINTAPGNLYNSATGFAGDVFTSFSNGSVNTQTISAPATNDYFDLSLNFTTQTNATFVSSGYLSPTFGGTLNSVELFQNNILVATASLPAFASTYAINQTSLSAGDQYTLDIQGNGSFFGLASINGSIDTTSNVSSVPLPSTLALFIPGLAGLAAASRRKPTLG